MAIISHATIRINITRWEDGPRGAGATGSIWGASNFSGGFFARAHQESGVLVTGRARMRSKPHHISLQTGCAGEVVCFCQVSGLLPWEVMR